LQKVKTNNMDKPKNRIKEVLEERGIKQTWLAERLDKSFCIVNSYVCNRRQPSLDVLFEIAKILNVEPKELITSNKNKCNDLLHP
jgi:transcriptional regulator with XRE-family HTH domain